MASSGGHAPAAERRDASSSTPAAAGVDLAAAGGRFIVQSNDDVEALLQIAALNSGESLQPAVVRFRNGSSTERLRLFWINYKGGESPYRVLEPGETHR